MQRDELVRYLDRYLRIDAIPDYGPQGLQVEGASEVTRIVFTVDAGQPCIDAAVKVGAQMQLVHHGLFWGTQELIRGRFRTQSGAPAAGQPQPLRGSPAPGRAS